MRHHTSRRYVPTIESLSTRVVPSIAMPPAYVEPAPAPAPAPVVEPAPIELAFNPDVTRLPAPIQTDSDPVLTMFQIASGQASIIDPTKLTPQPTPAVAPPKPTLPPLPPPLPTTFPTFP